MKTPKQVPSYNLTHSVVVIDFEQIVVVFFFFVGFEQVLQNFLVSLELNLNKFDALWQCFYYELDASFITILYLHCLSATFFVHKIIFKQSYKQSYGTGLWMMWRRVLGC